MSQKKLFLLDAFALIFRGYYALIKNPRINSKGMDTSAILGFTNSLLDVIRREKPDHLAVAFDKGGSDARNEVFPEYKANRQETPEAIKIAVPYIHKLLEAMHIPIVEVEGYEADDLIGTLSKQAEKAGYQTYMVTPDKDFAQLVSENIFMYRPARMGNGIEIWGIPEVKAKFEVDRPEQVIDYLGMMGDAVDNIPGLPGVGDKTAKKFIKQYGSMEGLFEHSHELKGKMKEKVEANKDLGLLSKQLATIMLDCPVEFHEEDFELNTPDFEKTNALFQELEFRRAAQMMTKLFGEGGIETKEVTSTEATPVAPAAPNDRSAQFDLFAAPETTQENYSGFENIERKDNVYQFVKTDFARSLLIKNLLQQKSVSFHLEGKNEDCFEPDLIGVSFSYGIGQGYFVPLNSENAKEILTQFKTFFEDDSIEKIGQKLKWYRKVLKVYGIDLNGPIFNTTLAHYLLQPDMRHDLNVLSETYLNYEVQQLESLIGKKGKNQLKFEALDLKKQAEYLVEIADVNYQLKLKFEKELEENGLTKLYRDIEIPLSRVLASMELEGIKLDAAFLNTLSENLTSDIAALEKEIYDEAQVDFNLASPKQLGDVLFGEMKLIDKPKKTKTGQYATGEEILSKLASEHKIVKNILEWRGLVKLKNTYVDALPNEVNKITGRVHTTFSQTTAATGRLSSNNPNLQNIPIRTERGKQVRMAFVPKDENYTLVAADYSQIELRIIASLSGDETMIASFNRGEDIHAATASKIFGIPLEEVSREQRGEAKAVNFGIIYGQGAFTLSQQIGKTRKEAQKLIDSYYTTFPKLKAFIANQVDTARENGFVETVLKRRRYLKNINSANAIVRAADERNAVNAPIQGSAADIIKIAMIRIHRLLHTGNYKSKMLLQVHDELVFDMHNSELGTLKPLIKKEMETAFQMNVPLTVDVGEGNNWLEAH